MIWLSAGDRLRIDDEALGKRREMCCESLVSSLVEDVQQFNTGEQHDDVTLIVARCA